MQGRVVFFLPGVKRPRHLRLSLISTRLAKGGASESCLIHNFTLQYALTDKNSFRLDTHKKTAYGVPSARHTHLTKASFLSKRHTVSRYTRENNSSFTPIIKVRPSPHRFLRVKNMEKQNLQISLPNFTKPRKYCGK
jgi:hypothetical protein